MKIGAVCGLLVMKRDFPGLCRWLAANGFDAVDMGAPEAATKATVEEAGLLAAKRHLDSVLR